MLLRSALTLVLMGGALGARAQELPAGPIRAFDGRLVVGGEIVATAGPRDHDTYFNFTDYEHNALRMFRAALSAEWRAADRLAFVAELRSEDFDDVSPYAAYVRYRPWIGRRFDIQAGRIPPVFGAFGRQAYSTSNATIGYPLAYQYLTSLRQDAAPETIDQLLAMRGRGWRSELTVGNPEPHPGIPLVSAFRWDTGVQAQWAWDRITLAGAVTNGTLSAPRVAENNGGKQVSGRVTVRPSFGLTIGASAARGAWLSHVVTDVLPLDALDDPFTQQAFGADVEYSRDYWLVRAETVWSQWRVPTPARPGALSVPVRAAGTYVEGRYRLTPRFHVGARFDTLVFSEVTGRTYANGVPTPWEAPVSRVEVAGSYALQRNFVARVAVQFNRREETRTKERTFVSTQLAYWF